MKPLPPIHLPSLIFHLALPVATFYGLVFLVPAIEWKTVALAIVLHFTFGFAYTAGYHRLWAHKTYDATILLRLFLALFGAGNFLGSIHQWCRDHRAHHRHVDTEDDPFNIHRGFFYTYFTCHIRDLTKVGTADVADLWHDPVVRSQHRFYPVISVVVAWIFPAVLATVAWDDPLGGLFIAGMLRTLFFLHIHYLTRALGHSRLLFSHRPYSVRTSARDSAPLSILTLGENHLNFHFEFPQDYRLGCRYFHLDATKWVLRLLNWCGLARNLKKTPFKEILKVRVQIQEERLKEKRKLLDFGPKEADLPLMSQSEMQRLIDDEGKSLILLDNFVLDVSAFLPEHPGGATIIARLLGKDCTRSFNGGVQRHSDAARNMAAMMRTARLAPE